MAGEPTNALEILNYLDSVMPYLPDTTIDELFAARSSGATETELQSIIYRERVTGESLDDQIIDYNNLSGLTNTLRWAHLADMLRQLLRTIKLYESQWELTTETAKINWQSSLAEPARRPSPARRIEAPNR